MVAFDESGNSGPNLLDPAQPVYGLASISLDPEVAGGLVLRHRGQAAELHYARMRKRIAGRTAILQILNSAELAGAPPSVAVAHKPYMVVGKLVDELIEPAFAGRGKNLYDGDFHIGLTNTLYAEAPSVCGDQLWDSLLRSFVEAVRDPTGVNIRALRRNLFACKRAAVDRVDIAGFLGIAASEEGGWRSMLEHPEWFRDSLDPAPTMLGQQLSSWSARVAATFTAIHDVSAVVDRWKPVDERLMRDDGSIPPVYSGNRKLVGPLSASALSLADSVGAPLIQVADVVAGSAVEWTAAHLDHEPPQGFASQLDKTPLRTWLQWWIWPPSTEPIT